jgi:membrane-bound lytic murein transglycosylase A
MRGGLAVLAGLLVLGACATPPRSSVSRSEPAAPRLAPQPATLPTTAPLSDLPGWDRDDHLAAFQAFRAGCETAPAEADHRACADAQRLPIQDETAARRFFEARFVAAPVAEAGLLTGYFAPEYEARTAPDEIFSAPVKPRPPELKRGADGKFAAYLARVEIETTPGPALAYMRPEDLFFLQIQGSGYLDFPDGRKARAAYAADNGQPFKGIAKPLAERGLLASDQTTGDGIRRWLADHRGAEAQAITDLDPRYVFFALEPDDGAEPKGSAGVPLPAGRAAAVDRTQFSMGQLLWIASEPDGFGAAAPYRRLVVALDEGGAIKGPARVDLFLGRGETAGREAGRIKQPLRLFRLIPKDSPAD